MDILSKAVDELRKIIVAQEIEDQNLIIKARGLEVEEAIGTPKRRDYPLIMGKEVMIEAEYNNNFGQAFTDHPVDFKGSLQEIIDLSLDNTANRALVVATLNAVLKSLGMAEKTVHCKDEEPELCAREVVSYLEEEYSFVDTILLIGFQPAILEKLVDHFGTEDIYVTDLNKQTIGKRKYGIEVLNGAEKNEEYIQKVDLILCTGSTVVNNSINELIEIFESHNKSYFFFGNTISGIAKILELPHLCFKGH